MDPVSMDCTFLKDPSLNSICSIDLSNKFVKKNEDEEKNTNVKAHPNDQEFSGEEPNYAVMEALLNTKMEMINHYQEKTEDIITISVLSDKETKK